MDTKLTALSSSLSLFLLFHDPSRCWGSDTEGHYCFPANTVAISCSTIKKGIWGWKPNLPDCVVMKYQCNICRDAWETAGETQPWYDKAHQILFSFPFLSLSWSSQQSVAGWKMAEVGVTPGLWDSHLQLSLCSFSDAIYSTRARAAAWLRVRPGEPWLEGRGGGGGGGGWEVQGSPWRKHESIICPDAGVKAFFRLRWCR